MQIESSACGGSPHGILVSRHVICLLVGLLAEISHVDWDEGRGVVPLKSISPDGRAGTCTLPAYFRPWASLRRSEIRRPGKTV